MKTTMKTVLLIDDDAMFRFALAEWLRFEGYEPIPAADGLEGLQLAEHHQPDAIFCDVNMPTLNGIEVLKQMRRNIATADIPFFFVTSEPHVTLRPLQQLGITGVIPKGADLGKFRHALAGLTPTVE